MVLVDLLAKYLSLLLVSYSFRVYLTYIAHMGHNGLHSTNRFYGLFFYRNNQWPIYPIPFFLVMV